MPLDIQSERVRAERLRVAEIRRQRERDIEAHVAAIKTARADIETKLVELQGHCERLQRAARLARSEGADEARYRLYHTVQTRMVGAMGQALKRASATDRVLDVRREDQAAEARQEREGAVHAKVKAAVREVFNLQLPKEDDLEQLFGEVPDNGS